MFWPANESLVTGSTITSVLPEVVSPMVTPGASREVDKLPAIHGKRLNFSFRDDRAEGGFGRFHHIRFTFHFHFLRDFADGQLKIRDRRRPDVEMHLDDAFAKSLLLGGNRVIANR